jgi:hypothetical protein
MERIKALKDAEREKKELEKKEAMERKKQEQLDKMKGVELLKSAGIQTKLNLNTDCLLSKVASSSRKVTPDTLTLTEDERANIKRKMLIKA